MIIITGATSGIGKAVFEVMETLSPCLCVDLDEEKLKTLVHNSRSKYCKVDLRKNDEITSLFDYCKQERITISGLVYCAGVSPIADYELMTGQEMIDTFEVNAFGFPQICQKLFKYQNRAEIVRVLAITSIASERASSRQAIYSSSKAALNSFVLATAQEGIKYGVRCNALSLGAVDTPMLRKMNSSESFKSSIEKHYPLGVMDVETIANVIKTLMSESFNNMTGSIIRIDSGFGVVH